MLKKTITILSATILILVTLLSIPKITYDVNAAQQKNMSTISTIDKNANSFTNVELDSRQEYKLFISKSDGTPLDHGYVQIYSLDENRNVFMGTTQKDGSVNATLDINLNAIKETLKQKANNIMDLHFILFAGDDNELVNEGLTITYQLNK